MKKICFVGVVLCAFTMFSCSSTGTVWDDTIPLEQCAKICFFSFLPTSYNKIAVKGNALRLATLPAGTAEFGGDVYWSQSDGYVRHIFDKKDVAFSCNLEAGKDYWAFVGYELTEDEKNRVWGIFLYNDEIKARIGHPGKDKLVAFIPFNPPVLSD